MVLEGLWQSIIAFSGVVAPCLSNMISNMFNCLSKESITKQAQATDVTPRRRAQASNVTKVRRLGTYQGERLEKWKIAQPSHKEGAFYIVTYCASFQVLSLAAFSRHLISCAIVFVQRPLFHILICTGSKQCKQSTNSCVKNWLTLSKLCLPAHRHSPPRVPAPESNQPIMY